MVRKMKLGTKIGLGFGLLLLLATVLGTTAVISMKMVCSNTLILDEEYIPEVELANSIERNSSKLMYEMRGYTLAEDQSYCTAAKQRLERLQEQVTKTKELGETAQHLTQLKSQIGNIESTIKDYSTQMDLTENTIKAKDDTWEHLTASAGHFISNCNEYLREQQIRAKKDIEAASNKLIEERFSKLALANEILVIGYDMRIECVRALATRDINIIANAERKLEEIKPRIEAIKKQTHDPANIALLDKLLAAANMYGSGMKQMCSNWKDLETVRGKLMASGNEVLNMSEELAKAGVGSTQVIAGDARSSMQTAGLVMITGLCCTILLGIAVSWLITRSITKPVRRIVQDMSEGAEQIAAASSQVSSSAQSIAEGATEQAAGLEETSSSLEEMSSITKQNADNAENANRISASTKKMADEGSQAMTKMNTAIADIQTSSDETAKIIKVIDEIAFQTNLLALNAAVEAARAGEAGKGFAVVAEEVRNLAMRSAEAAKNTANMIEESTTRARNGVEIAGQVSGSLEKIVDGIGQTAQLVDEIVAASREQAKGIDQISIAVTQMDKVTQSSAANAEENAGASEEMNSQAEQLRQIVNELNSMIHGSSVTAHTTPHIAGHHGNAVSKSDSLFHQIADSGNAGTSGNGSNNKEIEAFNL